jgi:hypothetical protein
LALFQQLQNSLRSDLPMWRNHENLLPPPNINGREWNKYTVKYDMKQGKKENMLGRIKDIMLKNLCWKMDQHTVHKMVQSMVHQYAFHYSIRSYVHLSLGIVVYISIFSDIHTLQKLMLEDDQQA